VAGFTQSMEALITALRKLPGVGPRTAERFAFFLLTQPASVSKEIAQGVMRLKETTRFCRVCYNLAEAELCAVCQDPGRDKTVVCAVEHPKAIIALEKAGQFKGLYHCLLGALSPLDGIGPKDLTIDALRNRLRAGTVRELIVATDSDMEGESTALYLVRELKGLPGLKITRIASGLPMGSNIEFSDQVTLTRALEGRRILT